MAFYHLKMFEIIATDFIQTLDSKPIGSTAPSLIIYNQANYLLVTRFLYYKQIMSSNSIGFIK